MPSTVFIKYSTINLRGKNIDCSQKKPSIALAEWDIHLYGIPPSEVVEPALPTSKLRATKIHFFSKISFTVGEEVSYMIVAAVSWFCPHPNQRLLEKPAEVWCHDKFEHPGIHSYLPVEKIASRCAHCTTNIDNDSVIVIVPLVD